MKPLLAFFTVMLAYLLTISSYAQADAALAGNSVYKKTSSISNHSTRHQRLLCNDTDESEVNNMVITLDDDDEESIIKKPVFIARYAIAFFHTFFKADQPYNHTDRISFQDYIASTGSPKYIVQRTLRI